MHFLSRMKLNRLIKRAKHLYERRERGDNVNVKYEIKVQKDLAKFYDKHRLDKQLAFANLWSEECYRAAALLGDPESQYLFAKAKLEEGKFWDQLSKGMYGRDIHKTYAQADYEEAFNYLNEADAGGSFLAKRLKGMIYIHGWGVPQDETKGFQLVVDSIEEEGAWDRATKIFEELGLNKPEFFNAMMKLRKSH